MGRERWRVTTAGLFPSTEDSASPWGPAHLHPHLQDASPLVLLVLRDHVASEECVAVEADAVGPVVIILELSPVVRAPAAYHLGEDGQEGLGGRAEARRSLCVPWPRRWECESNQEPEGAKGSFRRGREAGMGVLGGSCGAGGAHGLWAPLAKGSRPALTTPPDLQELDLSPFRFSLCEDSCSPRGLPCPHPLHLIHSPRALLPLRLP